MMYPYKILIAFLVFCAQIMNANVSVNALFSNHMVVQQKTKIPVWGWADPMEKITVVAGWGQKAEVVTSSDGTWKVEIKTPKAGGPFNISIYGKDTLKISDVLSGEVWLCSGQSNMDFALNKFVNDAREKEYQPLVEFIRNEIATADDSLLRHIEIPQTPSLYNKKHNFKANWGSATPDNTGNITATGYFFAKELRKNLNVPIGIIECSWGGTRIQPWISVDTYMKHETMKAYYEHEMKNAKGKIVEMAQEGYEDTVFQNKYNEWIQSGKTIPRPWPTVHPEKSKQIPATLHNGMISAIKPYAIKGVIWYQGESNSHYMEESYGFYLKELVTSWREEWGQGNFPFYCTQLAAFKVTDERSNVGWAAVSDQIRTVCTTLPKTGMAVLHDIGEAIDVHPHNKKDVGKRLSKWALKKDYNKKVQAVSGPLFKRIKKSNNKIIVKFIHVGSGLMVGHKQLMDDAVPVSESLKWFEVAGQDGVWKTANAQIISKNMVEVSHPDVLKPIKVRYAWSSNPEGANLYNKNGLPAAIFTSDQ
ncbi:sialate O-acetylesterase [Saccharicrinis sp. GN24d3]|uniref:sialate O-acetylesterase n=1 Tax=Saccharicrinis sp. GN24d3 TaxID=3458416 RepID=UPI0040362383